MHTPSLRTATIAKLLVLALSAPFAGHALAATPTCDVASIESSVKAHAPWWCRQRNAETVFIFVHGLGSDGKAAWLNDSTTPNIYWPRLVAEDPTFEDADVLVINYEADLTGSDLSVYDIASLVLQQLKEPAPGGLSALERKRIVFVTHSLGGIVVRELLITDSGRFQNKSVGLALVASPAKGSAYADVLAEVTKLFGVPSSKVVQLRKGNVSLRDLDKQFRTALYGDSILSRPAVLADLIGLELLETLAVPVQGVRLGWPVVPSDSAGRYFAAPPIELPEDHVSIVKPKDITGCRNAEDKVCNANYQLQRYYVDQFLRKANELEKQRRLQDPATCGGAAPFIATLTVEQQARSEVPLLTLWQTQPPNLATEAMIGARQADGRYVFPLGLPCPDQPWIAEFLPGATTKDQAKTGATLPSIRQFCLVRTNVAYTPRNRQTDSIGLNCTATGCQIVKDDQRLVREAQCPRIQLEQLRIAQRDGDRTATDAVTNAAVGEEIWYAPSLDQLVREGPGLRSGFSRFEVRSGPLPAGLRAAARFTYAIKVNGTPVLFDGWPAHHLRWKLSAAGELDIRFGLTNLDFQGSRHGRDRIELSMRLFDTDGNKLAELSDMFDYVALRSEVRPRRPVGNGASLEWAATYVAPPQRDKFELFVAGGVWRESDTSRAAWRETKRTLDRAALELDGRRVVGVLRPPLPPNPNGGLALGLQSVDSGQVQFTFDRQTADRLCGWFQQQQRENHSVPKSFRHRPYLYEMSPLPIDRRSHRMDCPAG